MQPILVQKYGGSSLATTAAMRAVARRVAASRRQGFRVVVVVSAMGCSTDELIERARAVTSDPDRRELDVLLASGEQASMALLAMALRERGEKAISLSGTQSGILTNAVHGNARILEIRPWRVRAALDEGQIVVIAGFQGISATGEVTTIGRGGSDTTAVALAAALDAEHCEIYTDVEGVWSTDPRLVANARPLAALHHEEMEALGWHGARVLKAEAVEFARDNGVRIRVLSSSGGGRATWVDSEPGTEAGDGRWLPRRPAVVGVAGRRDLIGLKIVGAEVADSLVELVAGYDLIFSYLEPAEEHRELYLSTEEMPDPESFRTDVVRRFGDRVEVASGLGAVTLVGFGIGSRPKALFDALAELRRHDFGVIRTFTDREALSFVVPAGRVEAGVRTLHEVFVESLPDDLARVAEPPPGAAAGREV